MLSVYRLSPSLSIFMPFIYFSCLNTLGKTSRTMFKNDIYVHYFNCVFWFQGCVHISNHTKLCTLNMFNLLYKNYTSIELLQIFKNQVDLINLLKTILLNSFELNNNYLLKRYAAYFPKLDILSIFFCIMTFLCWYFSQDLKLLLKQGFIFVTVFIKLYLMHI